MSGKRGFTLIELLVVLAIIGVLLAIAAPRYFSSVDRSKDAVLRSNLHQMREAIQQYYADKGKYPENLERLVTERYLREVPLDPVTERADTWIVVAPPDPEQSGVFDVRSGAPGNGKDGTRYRDW
ncbi:MAG: prepilin-type N-terminal cleavage/methylation domain-containing protein [Burkholderiales bacterium]